MSAIQKRINSFRYAANGIRFIFKSQVNFKFHCFAMIVAILAAWFFHVAINEWLAILLVIGSVLVSEALNTAIESTCDSITIDYNEKIGMAKDAGAAAVLISSIVAIAVGGIIFLPHLIRFFKKVNL